MWWIRILEETEIWASLSPSQYFGGVLQQIEDWKCFWEEMCDSNDPPAPSFPQSSDFPKYGVSFISQASQCTFSPFLVTSPTFFCVVPTSEGSEAKPHLDHISNISTEHLHNENCDAEERDDHKFITEYFPFPNFLC